jgi:hypothetical protein
LLPFYAASLAHALASVKSRYALPLHKATIVLPDFTRSCSADWRKKPHLILSKEDDFN